MKRKYTDNELIRLIKKGNERAKEMLVRRYILQIREQVKNLQEKYYFKGYSQKDLYQEAMISFLQALDTYQSEELSFNEHVENSILKHLSALLNRSFNNKNKVMRDAISYDTIFELAWSNDNDPEEKYLEKEKFQELWHSFDKQECSIAYQILSGEDVPVEWMEWIRTKAKRVDCDFLETAVDSLEKLNQCWFDYAQYYAQHPYFKEDLSIQSFLKNATLSYPGASSESIISFHFNDEVIKLKRGEDGLILEDHFGEILSENEDFLTVIIENFDFESKVHLIQEKEMKNHIGWMIIDVVHDKDGVSYLIKKDDLVKKITH